MKFVFIADFFSNEICGGGELNNQYLIESLRKKGHEVEEKKSVDVIYKFLEDNCESNFIIANFVQLNPVFIQKIQKLKYIIYEHDHKYIKSRNPALYHNYKVPKNQLINENFYKNAISVFCQSDLHAEIVNKNLNIENIKNLSGNMWSTETLDLLEKLSKNSKKDRFSVMESSISHKNTPGAVRYCESKEEEYQLIRSSDYYNFLEQLSGNNKFAFFPQTPETLSRVSVEARMLNVEVHINSKVGAAGEPWFKLKGKKLIDFMRKRKSEITSAVEHVFEGGKITRSLKEAPLPKISLITSLYKGDDHIEAFMRNITSQSIFEECELIIINANSPGNESEVIEKYMKKHSNIIYEKLDKDPGIYGCWNLAIEKSSGEFISNANLDDRRSKQHVEILATKLMNNPDVDLVYSECFLTKKDHESYINNSSDGETYPIIDFSPEAMIKCLPGCMPIWRRSMHKKVGNFNEKYKFAGDWDMWLRAVKNGSRFKRIEGAHGLYYFNPKGLSTDKTKEHEKYKEEKVVFHEYAEVFGKENCNRYREYFSQ